MLVVVPEHGTETGFAAPYASSSSVPTASLAEDSDRIIPVEEQGAMTHVRTGLGFFLSETVLWALGLGAMFGLLMWVSLQENLKIMNRLTVLHDAREEEELHAEQGKFNVAPPPAVKPPAKGKQPPANPLPGLKKPSKERVDDPAALQQEMQNDPEFKARMDELVEQLKVGYTCILIFTSLLWVIGAFNCLAVPAASRARGSILTALVCFTVQVGVSILALTLPPGHDQIMMIGGILYLLTSAIFPILYMTFLARVGRYIERPDLGVQAVFLLLARYVLGGLLVVSLLMMVAGQGNNNMGVQMVGALMMLGLMCLAGLWFIFYIVLLVRLRSGIAKELAA
jgi:hypothetical protein